MSIHSGLSTLRTTTGAAVGILALLTLAACAAETTGDRSAVTASPSDAVTVAEFDFLDGEAPENAVAEADGSVIVSMLGAVAEQPPSIVSIAPSGESTSLTEGMVGDMFLGLARGDDETTFYNVASTVPDRTGVWALPEGGTPQRLAPLPDGSTPNGMGLSEDGHTLFIAESVSGTIWSVPTSGGAATAWATGEVLELDPSAAVPLGVNGLKVHDGSVWVSNISDGTMLRVPVAADGSAGDIETVSDELDGIDDFSFVSDDSEVLVAALNGPNEVVGLCPDGSIERILDATDGLASPTAVSVGDEGAYVTNAGLVDNEKASLQRLTIPAHLCD